MYRRIYAVFIASIILLSLLLFSAQGEQKKDDKDTSLKADTLSTVVSFQKDVIPIFKMHCLPCHTEEQMNPSELYLDTFEGLMEGGKHGKAVIPGMADSSLIIKKLLMPPPFDDLMPMKSKTPLSADTIVILKLWINQGAKKN